MCCILHPFHAAPSCTTDNATVGRGGKLGVAFRGGGSGTDTISLRNNLPNEDVGESGPVSPWTPKRQALMMGRDVDISYSRVPNFRQFDKRR